jgi:hypothetical protein
MADCRSCGAEIKWARTEKNGKPIPVDPEPVEGGNLELHADDDGELVARALCGQEQTLPGMDLPDRYVSHFATCPNADQHRKAA